jgi:predicted nuclease with RNAse H fold
MIYARCSRVRVSEGHCDGRSFTVSRQEQCSQARCVAWHKVFVLSLGIDVGVRKGLHLVFLDDRLAFVEASNVRHVSEVVAYCNARNPDIVAIDSPPGWGLCGNSRLAERELRKRGLQSFATPNVGDVAKQENEFYGWMRVGFSLFEELASRFPRYRDGEPRATAIEVYPYASAVYIAVAHRPEGISQVKWRRALLAAAGVDTVLLTNGDLVDAGLAALTGIFALRGDYAAFGDPEEGVIVVPRRSSASRTSLKRI